MIMYRVRVIILGRQPPGLNELLMHECIAPVQRPLTAEDVEVLVLPVLFLGAHDSLAVKQNGMAVLVDVEEEGMASTAEQY